MPTPIYFLPGLTQAQATREKLAERGLADVISDCGDAELLVMESPALGPGGLAGVYCCCTLPGLPPPACFGFHPQRLDWQPASETLWIGLDRQLKTTPHDLLRPGRRGPDGQWAPKHPGYRLTLDDGQEWEIPVIRRPAGLARSETDLPRTFGWDSRGHFVERIDPRYQSAWDASEILCDLFFKPDGPGSLPLAIAADLCLLALSLNYRFTRDLQNRLHVFGSESWHVILQALVDWPFVRDWIHAAQKKTVSGPSDPSPAPLPDTPPVAASSPPGAEASPPLTLPAAAS